MENEIIKSILQKQHDASFDFSLYEVIIYENIGIFLKHPDFCMVDLSLLFQVMPKTDFDISLLQPFSEKCVMFHGNKVYDLLLMICADKINSLGEIRSFLRYFSNKKCEGFLHFKRHLLIQFFQKHGNLINMVFYHFRNNEISDNNLSEEIGESHQKLIDIFDSEESIFEAASKGNLENIIFHVECGTNVDSRQNNDSDRTLLHIVSKEGHFSVAEFLISRGADVNACDKNKYSPLHFAAMNCHLCIIELLILNRADINAINLGLYTPLHIAAQYGHLAAVEYLFYHGANKNARNTSNKTPLDYAKMNRHQMVVDFLNEHGNR